MPIPEVTVSNLTQATLAGNGVFDVLMRSVKAHLDAEFEASRIKGAEYATVYLGSLDLAMQNAMAFLLQSQKISRELELLDRQILLADKGLEKADVEKDILEKQLLLADKELEKADAEILILQANATKIPAEIAQIEAQTLLIGQQRLNAITEGTVLTAQEVKLRAEVEILEANAEKIPVEIAQIEAQTLLVGQQRTNAVTENTVLVAQECKLRAEFDLTQANTTRTNQELELLTQKTATERAQTTSLGVDDNSVIGRQKTLYQAQADGFKRDAEQKAAKLMTDTWSVRRTTDEGTVADNVNKLNDATVGRFVDKLIQGIGA